ncbi:MAG TPA: hypothetical protein EYG68_00980, partial [Leucothrix mucor]|nr:hypothetical protein [Leucothrix mucor]
MPYRASYHFLFISFLADYIDSKFLLGKYAMPTMDKRTFLKLLALGTAGTATGALPFLMQN